MAKLSDKLKEEFPTKEKSPVNSEEILTVADSLVKFACGDPNNQAIRGVIMRMMEEEEQL